MNGFQQVDFLRQQGVLWNRINVVEPEMVGYILRTRSLSRVLVKYLPEQVNGLGTDGVQHFLWEDKLLLCDFGDHGFVVALKGVAASQQVVHHDPHAPNIHFLVVELSLPNLGSHVYRSPTVGI